MKKSAMFQKFSRGRTNRQIPLGSPSTRIGLEKTARWHAKPLFVYAGEPASWQVAVPFGEGQRRIPATKVRKKGWVAAPPSAKKGTSIACVAGSSGVILANRGQRSTGWLREKRCAVRVGGERFPLIMQQKERLFSGGPPA